MLPRVVDHPDKSHVVLWTWLIIIGLVVGFVLVAGNGATGLWRGAFIDERNRISLSRVQMVLWTILVLSAFMAAALANIGLRADNPLAISIPKELWLAIGISVGSLVGTPLILSEKRNRPAKTGDQAHAVARTAATKGIKPEHVTTVGASSSATRRRAAPRGRISSAARRPGTPARSISAACRCCCSRSSSSSPTASRSPTSSRSRNGPTNYIDALPRLDSSFVILLGLSHAGYLGNKVVPKSGAGPSA